MLKKLAVLAFVFPIVAHAEENPYGGPTMPKFDFSTDATPIPVVHEMLKLAKVGPGDFVIDLGCGDGRIPITAAKTYGAQAQGVDLNRDILAVARTNAEKGGVASSVQFREEDIFTIDITKATVVSAVIWPSVHVKLRPILLAKLAPGTRVITNLYHMGDWKADKVTYVRAMSQGEMDTFPVYLWVVPARIDGVWSMEFSSRVLTVRLVQKYQHFSGSAGKLLIRNGKIEGTKVVFSLALDGTPRRYVGEVQPDGSIKGDGWHATRSE